MYDQKQNMIDVNDVAGAANLYNDIRSDGRCIYFLTRVTIPQKRQTIIQYCPQKDIYQEILPHHYNAQSSLHNYGGGSFNVDMHGGVYFINSHDGQIYYRNAESKTIICVSNDPSRRFADIVITPDCRIIFACGETHHPPHTSTLLCFIKNEHSQWQMCVFCDEEDFYASPRLSPDGNSIVWLVWNEGDMPWEGARLIYALIDHPNQSKIPKISHKTCLLNAACYNPQWADAHHVYVVHDNGYTGHIVCVNVHNTSTQIVTSDEYDGLEAMWGLEMRNFCVCKDGSIIAYMCKNADNHLLCIQPNNHNWIVTPLTHTFSDIQLLCPVGDKFCALVTNETFPATPYILSYNDNYTINSKKLSCPVHAQALINNASACVSQAQHISIPIADYPPCHALLYLPSRTPCPVIFSFHGGPAGRAHRGYKAKTQYWLQRGVGFLDIDYYGSTGYGRRYREKLYGQWGLIENVIANAFAEYLISKRITEGQKMALYGSSAGGYSALSIITHTSLFQAAVIAYGIADMAKLYAHSDRFEKNYLLKLLGATESTKDNILYSASPIHKASKITTPVLLLQGENDPIVPKEQTFSMYKTLQENSVETVYVELEGEKHGFKQQENIKKALEAEHNFYHRFLGYPLNPA